MLISVEEVIMKPSHHEEVQTDPSTFSDTQLTNESELQNMDEISITLSSSISSFKSEREQNSPDLTEISSLGLSSSSSLEYDVLNTEQKIADDNSILMSHSSLSTSPMSSPVSEFPLKISSAIPSALPNDSIHFATSRDATQRSQFTRSLSARHTITSLSSRLKKMAPKVDRLLTRSQSAVQTSSSSDYEVHESHFKIFKRHSDLDQRSFLTNQSETQRLQPDISKGTDGKHVSFLGAVMPEECVKSYFEMNCSTFPCEEMLFLNTITGSASNSILVSSNIGSTPVLILSSPPLSENPLNEEKKGCQCCSIQ